MKRAPKHILLVEDQAGVREALRFMLLADRHTVAEAKNGNQALDLFSREQFDLVMTDFAMPGMTGGELATRIKRLAPSQPILIISGFPQGLDDSQNLADAILIKPFSLTDLRKTIAELFC